MRVLTLAALLLVAGCLAPPGERPPGGDLAGFVDPMGHDHDHSDPALHAFAWRMEQVAHHPLAATATHTAGAHALDLAAGWLFAASFGGDADNEGGFFIFNVSDPASPKLAGRYRFPGPLGGDRSIEATSDAAFVALGSELRDCAGHLNPIGPGLYLIDVRNKAEPRVAGYHPATGVHSVSVHRIGNADYVFAVMAGQNVFRIEREPVPRLVAVAELPIGHDSMVLDDPLLGKPLLYASNGGGGFEVWDVAKPEAPRKLAGWNIPDRGDRYYIHTGAVQVIDGRRIAVVSSEDWEDYPSALWVLDATDLGAIQTLANWSAPGDHDAQALRYSMHNPRFVAPGILALAYYHGGVYVLDLAAPATPRLVGQFSPSVDTGWTPQRPATTKAYDPCPKFHMLEVPNTFDVIGHDGVIYAADLHTGLYTLRRT